MRHAFAARRFAAAVRTRRDERSLREAAAQIATVSAATLLRFEQEMVRPELPTFLAICDWLQLSPQVFLHDDDDDGTQILEAIEHDLRADGVLAPLVIDAFLVLVRAVRSRPAACADRVDCGETTEEKE
jgi:DNA-binding XRE family transcriptional regulator